MAIQEQDCRSPLQQLEAIALHKVTEEYYRESVSRFRDPAPEPKRYSREEVRGILEKMPFSCDDFLVFGKVDYNRPDNADVKLQRTSERPAEGTSMYSPALMLGLLDLLKATDFSFTKAKADEGDCIIFRANLESGGTVYINHSTSYP